MKDVLSVGGTTIDIFLRVPKDCVQYRESEGKGEIAFLLGQKIPLESCDICLGGNATNVAVGIARLGLSSSLISEVGDDEFAQKIFRELSEERVDTAHILQTDTPSSCAFGINFNSERTIFVEHILRHHAFVFPTESYRYMYLTSMGNEWEKAYSAAIWYAHEHRVPIVCNPGTLQLKSGLATIGFVLEKTELLFLNKDEAKGLLKIDSDDPKELLVSLHKLGPKTVVITDGEHGSFLSDGNEQWHLGITEHEVVERTGAGDAYASGFLGALIHQKSLPVAMQWGAINSSFVIGKVGAQKGLLSYNEMEQHVAQHQHTLVPEKL